MNYQEPSVKIVALLRDVFRAGPFKAIYDGDPDVIPRSNLPALCVVQLADQHNYSTAFQDQIDCQLQIRVVYHKLSDWTVTNDQTALVDTKIRNIVEERDLTTGEYLSNTIKGALLQRYPPGPNAFMQREMRFELNSVFRNASKTDEIVTREGFLTITVRYLVPIRSPSI